MKKKLVIFFFFIFLIFLAVLLFFMFNMKEKDGKEEIKIEKENIFNIEEKKYNLYFNETKWNEFLEIISKVNTSDEQIVEIKRLIDEIELEKEYKAFLVRTYVNYYGIKEKLIKNETIYCKDIFLNTINLNMQIVSIYGVIDSDSFIRFEGNWSYIKEELKKKLSKHNDSNLILIKGILLCK